MREVLSYVYNRSLEFRGRPASEPKRRVKMTRSGARLRHWTDADLRERFAESLCSRIR